MNTSNHKIPEAVKELLQNSYFILWCYTPTDKSDEWWANWAENYPERKADISEARRILLSTKLNNIHPSEEDYTKLYARLEKNVVLLKKKQQKYIWPRVVAAACVVLAMCVGSLLYFQKNNQTTFFTIENLVPVDSTLTEVELKLTNLERVSVTNNAVIRLKNSGTIHVNQEEITVADNTLNVNSSKSATKPKMNVLQVPRGRYSSVILADGTKVWVNSGSVLHFPNSFEKEHRTIYANGEIYLEVAKDTSRPFYVKTSKMDVRVLGTSFNVTAYNDETYQSVVLVEGRVEIKSKTGSKQVIEPTERLILTENQISVSKVNTYDYTSWKDGIFLFTDQSLGYVAQRLSRYYHVDFICTPEIKNYSCSGKLVLFDNLNKVLHTLEKSFPISCEETGNKIKLSSNPNKKMPMK